jgi:predicted outer membrane repeat protein
MTISKARATAGAGISLGALLAAPAAAGAEDIKVTNLNDSGPGSLRQAILDANTDTDADRILFKSKLSGEIDLTSGDLNIYRGDLEIRGPGARKLTVGDDPRVFYPTAILYPAIDVTISGLTVSGAHINYSAGAVVSTGDVDLTLSRVTISGNSAVGVGGAIGVFYEDGTLTVENSTISGNSAGDDGGAIYAKDVDVSIRNSTISGNEAGSSGGAIYALNDGGNPSVEIRNSTISGNQAGDSFGGGGLYEGGILDTEIRGSIIAGNSDGNGEAPDLDDGPWATSFSLIGDTTGPTIIDGGSNLLDLDPQLKPLKNNGGPTNTHALKTSSPARNSGPSDAPHQDQRGAPRKGQPDIGAYELTKCEGVIVNRVGTTGKDKLKGTKRKDGILGLGGNDKLSGKKGKDGLCGGQGKDKLKGGPGKDKLNGGPGKDKEIQ